MEKLFTTDSFWHQWKIYRDLIYILKRERLDSYSLKEQRPSGIEHYKEKELTYFYRLFCYSLSKETPYHAVATLLDIFRCQRLMHYIYPGFSQIKPEQYISVLNEYASISTEGLCRMLIRCWCGERARHDLINATISELRRRLVSRAWIEKRAQQLVSLFGKEDKPEAVTITGLLEVSQAGDVGFSVTSSKQDSQTGSQDEGPGTIEEYLQGGVGQDSAASREGSTAERQGEDVETEGAAGVDVDDASSEIAHTRDLLASYFRVMQRMRNAYRKDRGRYENVYARVRFEENEPEPKIKVSPEDKQIAKILRRIVLRTKLREDWDMTGTALDIKRYVNLLASDNASPEVFKVSSLRQGGKVVFLADASGSMTEYYDLEARVYSILKEAFSGYIEFDLFCFDSPERGIVNIRRRFYDGELTPVVFAANYIVNWMLAFSSQYSQQVLVLFSDMEENVSRYRGFKEGLEPLLRKVQRSRIKIVGAIPAAEYNSSHSLIFRRFFPAVSICREGIAELTQDLIRLLRAIRVA